MTEVFLGTIVLEPNRWFGVTHERWGTTAVSAWLDAIAAAGFDGIELWESHFRDADPEERQAILDHPLPSPSTTPTSLSTTRSTPTATLRPS